MNWKQVKLKSVAKIVTGSTPKTSIERYWGGNIYWATPKDLSELDGKYISTTPATITQEGYDSCSTTLLPPNSVLLSSRAPIGHVAINTIPMATNQGFKSFVPNPDRLVSDYLYYWLKANKRYLQELGRGATFKEISKKIVENIEIPLPSLPEQKRIIAILDKTDELRAKRRRVLTRLDDLLQSVFLEMFGDPMANPKGWETKTMEEVAASDKYSIKAGPFGSSLKKEYYVQRGYKIYGQEQVIRDDLTYGDYYIDEKLYEKLKSNRVSAGDILISLVGTYGEVSIVPNNFEPGIINPRLMKITLDPEKMNPVFFKTLLGFGNVKRQIENLSHGGTMGIVNVGIMRRVIIPVPPMLLQNKFVQFTETIQNHKKLLHQSLQKLDEMFNSLRQLAFKGELAKR